MMLLRKHAYSCLYSEDITSKQTKEGLMMFKIMKKSITAVLVLIALLALSGQSFAAENPSKSMTPGIIKPLWINIDKINVNLTFAGSQANCSARVYGKTGTTMITGTAVLARQNSNGTYTTVKTWSNLVSYSDTLTFNGIHYVTTGYTYRLSFTAAVTRSGSTETVTASYSAYAG